MKKKFMIGAACLLAISCTQTATKSAHSVPAVKEAGTESIIHGIEKPHNANRNTVFDEDSVERYDEGSYLTLTFRGKKFRMLISTETLEQNRILNKDLPITDEVGVLFAYDKSKIPCVNTSLLAVPVEVIFMDSNARITKIARESGSVCATTGTQFAMIVPKNFTIKNAIQLNDKIKFADAYKNQPARNDVEKSSETEESKNIGSETQNKSEDNGSLENWN